MSDSFLRHSVMARVNKGSRSVTWHPHVYSQVEWAIPAFTPQPHGITALWPVFIFRPTEGRRLSRPWWLGEILRWFARPKMVTHPSTSRSLWKSNSRPSSHESRALTTRLPNHYPLCTLIRGIRYWCLRAGVKGATFPPSGLESADSSRKNEDSRWFSLIGFMLWVSFSTLTLLFGWQERYPVYNQWSKLFDIIQLSSRCLSCFRAGIAECFYTLQFTLGAFPQNCPFP